jgi:hypothetical protein
MLVAHVRDRPCTRPWAWWRFEELPPRATVRPKARDIPPEPPGLTRGIAPAHFGRRCDGASGLRPKPSTYVDTGF